MNTKINNNKTVVQKGRPISNGVRKIRKCKEKGCQGKIPMEKSLSAVSGKCIPTQAGLIAWFCRVLGYCRYCYLMYYPKRPRSKLPVLRQGSERFLSWDEHREMEQAGFNPEVWSEDFRRQMRDYRSARMRGEVRI